MSKELLTLSTAVGQALQARGLLLATAESCTGGGVAQA
ncbi:MAG: CinA family protein, partial [Janthinobacterium sp.]